ncbi:MAG: AtpZ/AtpI family protein [Deltaproteobacteria bacterium]|nr:AtpZ/AtpI family protein [Deltaproteobacteria bacterium]
MTVRILFFLAHPEDNFIDKPCVSLLTKLSLVKNLTTTWKLVGDGLQLGASIAFAILIGAALGYWLDGKFGTFPYLSIIFFFFGIAAAGRNVWIEVRKQLCKEHSGRTNELSKNP